jgi:hypothetical protein
VAPDQVAGVPARGNSSAAIVVVVVVVIAPGEGGIKKRKPHTMCTILSMSSLGRVAGRLLAESILAACIDPFLGAALSGGWLLG